MKLFETALEKIGRIISREHDVKVVHKGSQAYTDGKTIVLPTSSQISGTLEDNLNGFLDHEVSHVKYSNFSEVKKCDSSLHKQLLNAIEDIRVEREMGKAYAGCKTNLRTLRERLEKDWVKNWSATSDEMKLIYTLQRAFEGETAPKDDQCERALSLVKDLIDKLQSAKSTKSVRLGTSEILKRLEQEQEQEQGDQDQDDQGDQDQDDQDQDEGDQDQDDQGDQDQDDQDQDNQGDQDDQGDQDQDDQGDQDQDDQGDQEGDQGDHDQGNQERNQDPLNYDFDSEEKFKDIEVLINQSLEEMPEGDLQHTPFTTEYDIVKDLTNMGDRIDYAHSLEEVKPKIAALRTKLEKMMKASEVSKTRFDQERGAINKRALYKLPSDKNFRKPFSQKTTELTNNVAVEILVDQSGSMYGRVRLTKQAVIAMSEALKSLNISFEVTGFDAYPNKQMEREYNKAKNPDGFNRNYENLRHAVFKDFNSDNLSALTKIRADGNNYDSESIRWAANRLMLRKEPRKILIVFSDGHPCAHANESVLSKDLKKTAKEIGKKVELIGIGIQSDAVRSYYSKNVVVNHIEDLPSTAMIQLQKALLKGSK